MVVQHNLLAMNSNRMLNVTTKRQAKSTEKLSSGYRINRAADDAAGLSISEKMRKQIRGLTQASSNAQDGISMVQIADGAMAEVSDMLHRANELAVKAANGTLSKDDRGYIQDEINQLQTEIDRVSTTTKFNETYVLKGGYDHDTLTLTHVGKVPAGLNDVKGTSILNGTDQTEIVKDHNGNTYLGMTMDFSKVTASNFDELDGMGFSARCLQCTGDITIKFVTEAGPNTGKPYHPTGASGNSRIVEVDLSKINKGSPTLGEDIVKAIIEASQGTYGTSAGNPAGHAVCVDYDKDNKAVLSMYDSRGTVTISGGKITGVGTGVTIVNADNLEVKPSNTNYGWAIDGYKDNIAPAWPTNEYTTLHVGADSSKDNKIEIRLPNVSCFGLGLKTAMYSEIDDRLFYTSKVDVTTSEAATATIDVLSEALQVISEERSRMGAYQNRLEHTIANLDNVVENTTAAESAIRDTDMATEMVSYSNNNILAQAGQAMLAQANQSNQGVLSLLQ